MDIELRSRDHYFTIEEGERQAVLLALAELALSRPGWDDMLRRLAEKLNGLEMFDGLKLTSADRVASERAPLFVERDAEIARLRAWIADIQSGMYINCVYCGHRYGPDPGTPVAMADVLKAHIEVCPEHPASKLKAALEQSVKLQAHYAELLNMHDGGQRIVFKSAEEWMARLQKLKAQEEPKS
jgi:hypothetical protein